VSGRFRALAMPPSLPAMYAAMAVLGFAQVRVDLTLGWSTWPSGATAPRADLRMTGNRIGQVTFPRPPGRSRGGRRGGHLRRHRARTARRVRCAAALRSIRELGRLTYRVRGALHEMMRRTRDQEPGL
jgi:hypothetical protein